MATQDIRLCRYQFCCHSTKQIDVNADEYVVNGRSYFHKDCYLLRQKAEAERAQEADRKAKARAERAKEQQTKQPALVMPNADVNFIINLWRTNINNNVMYAQLRKVLNTLISKGLSSEYIVFMVQYIITNHMKLQYPYGLYYYIDDKRIKEAYGKTHAPRIDANEFTAVEPQDEPETVQTFSVKPKQAGFHCIFGDMK